MKEILSAIWMYIVQFFGLIKLNDVIDITIIAVAFYYIGK